MKMTLAWKVKCAEQMVGGGDEWWMVDSVWAFSGLEDLPSPSHALAHLSQASLHSFA